MILIICKTTPCCLILKSQVTTIFFHIFVECFRLSPFITQTKGYNLHCRWLLGTSISATGQLLNTKLLISKRTQWIKSVNSTPQKWIPQHQKKTFLRIQALNPHKRHRNPIQNQVHTTQIHQETNFTSPGFDLFGKNSGTQFKTKSIWSKFDGFQAAYQKFKLPRSSWARKRSLKRPWWQPFSAWGHMGEGFIVTCEGSVGFIDFLALFKLWVSESWITFACLSLLSHRNFYIITYSFTALSMHWSFLLTTGDRRHQFPDTCGCPGNRVEWLALSDLFVSKFNVGMIYMTIFHGWNNESRCLCLEYLNCIITIHTVRHKTGRLLSNFKCVHGESLALFFV